MRVDIGLFVVLLGGAFCLGGILAGLFFSWCEAADDDHQS